MISHRVRRAQRDVFFTVRVLMAVGFCSTGLFLGFFAFDATASNSRVARSPAAGEPAVAGKIAPWVHAHTTNGQQAEFLVVLADQTDLSYAKTAKTKQERGRHVRDALWSKAQQTQQPILQWLREHKIEHRAFYIVNAIWVKADAETAMALAARPDVLRMEGNPQVRNPVDPIQIMPASPNVIDTVETGIAYSQAPQVWSLGYTGQGIVVAGADTGYRWTHAALKNQYRGWDGISANHDYNWHDSVHTQGGQTCGHDSPVPCDDNNHGTHTMGTAVGTDGVNNLIGMAPGSKWIGCRNMDRGTGTPARYIECMEFFLAPYPVGGTTAQGDPNLAPDITTNSWGCPTSEGCSPDTLQAAVEAQRAAGIFMVAAAGNDGTNGCHTIADPPAIYDALYTVGALNSGSDIIANFSSRGPVTVDNSSRRKPDLCAPGTNVRSSIAASDTSYSSNFSGTSMATPHVAGAVALLWSAEPSLRNEVEATDSILNASAVPISSTDCSSVGVPNNTYGYGRLDAKAAVDVAFLMAATRTAISHPNESATVTFYAGLNRTYRLERKFDLNDSMWSPVPGVNDLTAAADGPAQLTDPNSGNGPGFYRVRLVQ